MSTHLAVWCQDLGTHPIARRFDLYILDTSAFYALGGGTLDAAREAGLDVRLSPYGVWEMLCHLDDGPAEFEKSRQRLLKARRLPILDDPRAQRDIGLGLSDPRLLDRVEDAEVIGRFLEILRHARDLETFYSAEAVNVRGQMRLVRGAVERTRAVLGTKAARYQELVGSIMERLRLNPEPSDEQCDDEIYSLVHGIEIVARGRGAPENQLADRAMECGYLFFAYVYERARTYLRTGGKIDVHDFEDSEICSHLGLNNKGCLITADKGILAALQAALDRLVRLSKPSAAGVMSCSAFRQLVDGIGHTPSIPSEK